MYSTRALLCFALLVYVVTIPATSRHVSKTSTHKILEIIHRLLKVADHNGHRYRGRLVAFDVALTKNFRGRKNPDKVLYNKINVNIGRAYHNGEFVCPLKGVYEFSWTSLGVYGTNAGSALYVNDNRRSRRYNFNFDRTGKHYLLSTTSLISHLKKGDRVWIGTYNGHVLHSNNDEHSNFQGKLLQAD